VNAGAASDAAGNTNTASTSTDNTVTYDATAPTVTINQAVGQADPTNTSPINFTVVFSEAVTGSPPAASPLAAHLAAPRRPSSLAAAPPTTLAVSGMTSAGTVTATVNANAATDSAGNSNTASTSTDNTVTYDATAPSVTINQAVGQADPTNHFADQTLRLSSSEAVTGFSASGVTLGGTSGGTKTAIVTGSGTTYNVAVSGMTSAGTVTATVNAGAASDAAGNHQHCLDQQPTTP
jgi:hypothetical protein